ncbi:hypothetical protein DSCA_10450 [Desulfosarcina alkanivorans]|jgi:hypothetical protein|uniref:Uncharacterized protein n=1 Tax=Desulfosarcina alkanivorans TaxID=571177 RepID=A0A5K7YF70_9BACT|nr:hypothetical protein DSCA_10450 [Desulfosarcina alkanivorans]
MLEQEWCPWGGPRKPHDQPKAWPRYPYEGIRIDPEAALQSETVTIVCRQTLFTVTVSAHPYGEYVLTITKL